MSEGEGKGIRLPDALPVMGPAAVAYQRAMDARKQQSTPVAGGPTPPIPRLDGDPDPRGVPMAQQARRPSIVEGTQPQAVPMPKSGFGGLSSNDTLPPEAKNDPAFMEGSGSMLAVNQPNLAYKYGVIRKGQRVPPQMIQAPQNAKPQRPTMTEQDVVGLEELAKLQKKVDRHQSGEAQAEADSQKGLGGMAAKLGEESEKTQETATSAKAIDDFDFDTFRQLITKDVLNNAEQKEIIEARLEPLDLTNLIVDGFIKQIVPIVPGKLEVEYRSVNGEDQIGVKRLIALESKRLDMPESYLMDKHSIMSVAAGLYAINKRVLPDHRDDEGHFDDEAFLKKFNLIARYPVHMIASLGLNFFWFDARVRKLFVAERVGNG